MDFYILPFANKILSCSPALDEQFIPHLAEEIERLRMLNKPSQEANIKKGKIPEDVKCVNTQCTQKLTKNTNVSAQCDVCKNFEHFKCAGTKALLKEEIKEDLAKFVCSLCIDGDPSLGREVFTHIHPQVLKVTPVIHNPSELELEEIVIFEENNEDRRFDCDKCEQTFHHFRMLPIMKNQIIRRRIRFLSVRNVIYTGDKSK